MFSVMIFWLSQSVMVKSQKSCVVWAHPFRNILKCLYRIPLKGSAEAPGHMLSILFPLAGAVNYTRLFVELKRGQCEQLHGYRAREGDTQQGLMWMWAKGIQLLFFSAAQHLPVGYSLDFSRSARGEISSDPPGISPHRSLIHFQPWGESTSASKA